MRFVDKLHTDYNPCLTLVWGLLTSYTETTIHVLLQYEVRWQVTHRLQSMSYSGIRFVDNLHTDYNPCLTLVWGLLTSYTQTTIHVLLRYEVRWQVTHRLQSMSYSGMRFVDKLQTDYNSCLTPLWGLLTSYTHITIHVLLWYEVCWQVTHRLQIISYSGMRFVDKLHTVYNPCLTPLWGSLTSYTQITIHVVLRYEVRWQVTHRLQSMSYSIMRFVDKLHTYYNPYLTLVWGLLTSYTQITIHILLRYEVSWQVTHILQSMSYSGMRFVDKLHADFQSMSYSGMRFVDKLQTDYNSCLTPYEVRWQVTHRLQSMSYSIMRFVDKLHIYYNPCLTLVWGLLTSYTQITIHILLRYEVCWQVTHILQSMSYSGMRLVDKLHADFQSMSYSGMRFVDKLHADYNPCLTLVWGLLTSYTQTTIHVLLHYEVRWQVTYRLQSMSYSGMRLVDKLHTDYNPCLTLIWGLLTSYTQTTIHVLLQYEVRWQVTHRLQSISYSGMRFVDKLHADYNPCLTPVWGSLTSYTQTTIHVLLWYEVCWQVTDRLQLMSYSGMRFVDKLHADYNPCLTLVWGLLTSYTQTTIQVLLHYEVRWQVTHRLQSMSYSGMRFVDKLHADYNPCLTPLWGSLTSYIQITIHVLLWYEVCWQVTHRLQSMSYSGMRFVDKLHTDYNSCLTPVWGSLTSYTQITIHILLRYEVCWQVTHRLQSMSYSGMRFVDKLHADYNPCLTPVWGSLTSYTQTTIHVLLWYEVCWQVTDRLQLMSYSGMRFVDKFHADYNPCLTLVWGLLTSYTQTTIQVLLHYEVRWQVTHSLQSMSYSGMRFVEKLHADYNPCFTQVWGSLTSYTPTTIHVLLWYEVRWQVTHRLQSISYSGMRFVDKLHTHYNPCLTPLWGSLTSYTHITIHVLLWYEVRWQVTRRLQSMSYSGMRFDDKLHTNYNPCLTPLWGSLTSYTHIIIHVLLWYEVCWQVTHRLQSMSYSGMRFVDKLHTDYNSCLTPVWGSLTSYTQITIHVLLRYKVCWQVTHRLQSMYYSGMMFVDKLHADYNPCLTPVWGSFEKLHTDYNPCLTLVWGLLTSYTQTTNHILLWYEVCWQVTHSLQSMSYSHMRFVDKLHTDYNSSLTPVWGSLTSYTQTTIHVLLHYEVRWQVTHILQSMSYSGMRFVDKLHTDYNPYLTPVWGFLTSYTNTTIHVLLWYEVCWQVTRRLPIHVLLWYEVRWQVTRRLQSMSYSGMRFVDKLHTDYNPCLTPLWGSLTSYTQITIHVLLWYEVCWQVTRRLQSMSYSVWGSLTSYTQTTIHVLLHYEVRWQVTHILQSMSYSGMRFVDKLHTDYNPYLTPVWGFLTSYTHTTIHVLLWYEVCW